MALHKNEQGMYIKDIDGVAYEFAKWNTEDALETLFDLGAVLGKPLGEVGGNLASKEGMQQELSHETIGSMISRAAEQLTTNRPMVMGILRKLGTHQLFANGVQVVFNVHYKDNLPHLFKVATANAEVQYESFFNALGGGQSGGLLARIKQAAKGPAAQAPQGSTTQATSAA